MIVVNVRNNSIVVNFRFAEEFSSIVQLLKDRKCRFDPTHKDWVLPIHKYDVILDDLMELDVVELSAEVEQQIEELLAPTPELKISTDRILFDSSIMHFPPIQGKAPNENFQKVDITRAINRNRYALFLDMGLGKAYIMAAIIAHMRKYNKAYKALIVTSGIGALNMVHEMKKFIKGITDDDIIVMTKAGKDRELFKADKNIAITNYNTFKYICDYYYQQQKKKKPGKSILKPVIPFESWFEGSPGILLLDESHIIGNNSSQMTNRIMTHKDAFEYRYVFTGTPADKPEKLYTQLKVLDTSIIDGLDYTSWLDKYAVLGTQFSKYAISTWRFEKVKQLNERIQQDHAVFRKTEDCMDLPVNRLKKIYVQLEKNHADIYKAFIIRTLEKVQIEKGNLLARHVVNTFPFLQLALDNPKLLLKHEDMLTDTLYEKIEAFKLEDHKKIEAADAIVQDRVVDKKEQGIIWCHHPDTAKMLAERYKDHKPLVITGETEDRDSLLQAFKADKTHKLLIAGITVLNTSVTLTNCLFQIYFERIYNYSQYSQSLKRIHRIGQTELTHTYVLLFDSTIDIVLDKSLRDKNVLTDKLVAKNFLTKDEWLQIFEAEEQDEFNFEF